MNTSRRSNPSLYLIVAIVIFLPFIAGGPPFGGRSQQSTTIGVRAYAGTDLLIPPSLWTNIVFDSENFDTDVMHRTDGYSDLITFNHAGVYQLTCQARYTVFIGGENVGVRIVKFPGNILSHVVIAESMNSNSVHDVSISTVWNFMAGEFVVCQVYQDSDGNQILARVVDFSPVFTAVLIP